MTQDWPDFTPHPHMATAQYNQGVPLARKPVNAAFASNSIAAAGNAFIVPQATFDQPAWQLILLLGMANIGPTIPFGKVDIFWFDSASAFGAQSESLILPAAGTGFGTFQINGPTVMDTIELRLTNIDPGVILDYSFSLTQVSHTLDRLKCVEASVQSIPGFTRPALLSQVGNLGSVGVNVGASGQQDRLAATWAGDAVINVDNLAGTVPVQVRLLDPGIALGSGALYGVAGDGAIWSVTVPAGATANDRVSLPNGPVVIREINPSATTAVQPTTTLTRILR